MNILHKVQLATLITIIVSVSILIYIDSAYAQFDAPLKQVKAGVPIQDIQCNEGKLLIHKQDTLSPACVGNIASNDLIFPPYSWAVMRLGAPAEPMSQEAMCEWYPDTPLVQKNCIKIKSIDSFDFSELETYSNPKEDYFERIVTSNLEGSVNNFTYEQISDIYNHCLAQHNGEDVFTMLFYAFNSTHYIDNNLCKWFIHWDGYTSPFGYEKEEKIVYPGMGGKMLALNIILDNCDCQKANITPCETILLSWENSTHAIDNIICEFVTLEQYYGVDFETDYTEKFD